MAFQIRGIDFDNTFEPVRSGAAVSTFTGLTTTTGSTTKNVEYMALTGTATNPNKDGYWKYKNTPYSALGKNVKIPKSLTVNGTWANPQRGGQAPDTAGLTYTVTYYNGMTATVSATLTGPTTWDNVSVPTTKYATFQYTENGISVSASKAATVYEYYQGTPLALKFTANGTITISNAPSGNMWYSINNGIRTALPATGVINVTTNNEVRLWANRSSASASTPLQISCNTSSKFYAYGNVMSLISANADFAGLTSIGFNNAFYRLFRYNSKLDISSSKGRLVLPATTLADSCYYAMFFGCTSLTTAPALPATTLAQSCYYSMFQGCTSLTTPPVLPATTLASSCYSNMFWGCTSLTTAPVLPATTLAVGCYINMFWGCSSLNSITCYAEDISASGCTSSWVQGVAASGTFIGSNMTNWTIGNNGIPTGWVRRDPYQDVPLTLELTAAGTITVTNPPSGNMWYSINRGSRTAYSAAFNANAGDKVSFYANRSSASESTPLRISCDTSSKFYAYGNVMSLISADSFENLTSIGFNYAFYNLFFDYYTPQLIDISPSKGRLVLPATTLTDYCYAYMFGNCASLTTAPELPATNLASDCYDNMFKGCTSLTTAPALPATTLADYCYQFMFAFCFSLTTAPELPATTLANSCYNCMFEDCTSLTTAPALPATSLASGCYSSMFEECTSLTTAPELPATNLVMSCYDNMFSRCSSLTTAPALPATTLKSYCYDSMFEYCTSLTTAPELPATTLATHCYYRMFRGCTSLNSITCYATDISATRCTQDWVENVAASGTFMTNLSTQWTIGINGIPTGWTKRTPNQEDPLTFELTANGTITINNPPSGNMWYSINGGSRTAYSAAFSANAGDKVSLYANRSSTSSNTPLQISCNTSSKFYAYGNIMSLISADNFENLTSIEFSFAFYQLFQDNTRLDISTSRGRLVLPATTLAYTCYYFMFSGCTSLTTPPELPATNLGDNCYGYIFRNCTSLTTAPALPATTLTQQCYRSMFVNCTSLTTAPTLPATTMANSCYYYMFWGCTSLTTAPALPATTIAPGCYSNMFASCTSLTSAPALPATDLTSARYCYSEMFEGCTSLTTPPALPATTLAGAEYCYHYMFNGCSSLTTAPALPATTLTMATSCYSGMFEGCTSLTTPPVLPATTLAWGCYHGMFKGCTSLTTAPTLPVTTLAVDCYYSMFSGCTSLTTAPTLPATNLTGADDCYHNMFSGCKALTTAPALPATTLAKRCYSQMFFGCDSLTTPPALPATTLTEECYYQMFLGCDSLTTAPVLPAATLVKGCYYQLFSSCEKLTSITCYATYIDASWCTVNWVEYLPASGTFRTPSSTKWTTGRDGIPSGWTRVNI